MKTNRTLKLITLTAAIFGFAATSFGQVQASVTDAKASATIIRPLTLSKLSDDLNFGVITTSATQAGSVTVTPDGVVDASSTLVLYSSATVSAASFRVTGEAGYSYIISLPNDEDVTITDGTNTMEVVSFTSSIGPTVALTGTTLTTITSDFTVGATLLVDANQPSGEYEGNFTVTVDYE